ncbi:hypothetical protein Emag_006018 [Eimeria magna]
MTDPAYAAALGGYPPYTSYSPYAAAAGPAAAAADCQWGAWGPSAARGSPAPVDPETEPDALQSRCLFFGRLAPEVTEDVLRSLCEPFGDLRKVTTYPEKHMAFVEFGTLYIRPTNGMSASTTLNDPNSLDAYRRLFSSYGDIKKVSVNRKRDSEKFIEYHDVRDAAKALEALNGHNFNGVSLQICFAQNASRTFNREPASRRVGVSRTPEPFGYGPCRSSGYGIASRGYGPAPYSAPPMMGQASAYGPYGVCTVQTAAAAAAPSYVSPYGYQQQQQQQQAAAAAYAPSWPPANPGVSGGAAAAPAYGGPPSARGPMPMTVYGGAPGTGSPQTLTQLQRQLLQKQLLQQQQQQLQQQIDPNPEPTPLDRTCSISRFKGPLKGSLGGGLLVLSLGGPLIPEWSVSQDLSEASSSFFGGVGSLMLQQQQRQQQQLLQHLLLRLQHWQSRSSNRRCLYTRCFHSSNTRLS